MDNELVPDTYDYTKLFRLWKGKGIKLDLNMTRYIHGKEWDAKFLEALVPERMKGLITKHCPEMHVHTRKSSQIKLQNVVPTKQQNKNFNTNTTG